MVSFVIVVIKLLVTALSVNDRNGINIRLEELEFVTEDRRDKGVGRELEVDDGEGVVSIGEVF